MDVELPDGSIIKGVPDGTTKADLAAKLKANGRAVPAEWLAAPKPADDKPTERPQGWKTAAELDKRPGHLPVTAHSDYSSTAQDTLDSYRKPVREALTAEAHGVADPVIGIGQAVAHVLGMGDAADKRVQEREARIKAEGTDTGFRTVGNIMAPTNYVGPAGTTGNALRRVGTAIATGAAANSTMPVTEGDFWTEKGKQAAVGAAGGGVAGVVGEVAGAALSLVVKAAKAGVDAMRRYLGAEMPSSLRSAAVNSVLEAFGRDEKAGGPKLTEVMDTLRTARDNGKPMTLLDAGGADVKGIGGYLSRQPGDASAIVNRHLDTRDAGAAERLHGDITKFVSGGDSMKQTATALTATRAAAAKPLYDVAFAPGSTAPLQGQFEAEFGRIQTEKAAAARELAEAERGIDRTAGKAAQTGQTGDRAMLSADARSAASGRVAQAQAKIDQLAAQEAKTTAVMREAQRAAAAGERGGVWSPRIQQFVEDPIVKAGIRKGLEVQRLEALAEGREFNPREFAVTGTDAAGEPVVSAVPNMRLLDSAKRGLDEILEGYRDKTTGRLVLDQRGRAIENVRKSLVSELDRVTTDPKTGKSVYAEARAAWSGPSQAIDAMQRGRDLMRRSPEEIADMMKKATPNEREFIRLGLADRLRQAVDEVRLSGDESKALIKNQRNKDQILAAFDDPKEARKFIDNILAERKMFDTGYDVRGNSATARRLATDHAMNADMEALGHGVEAAKHTMTGNAFAAVRSALQAKRALGWRKNALLNREVASILTDPNITLDGLQAGAGTKLLRNFPGPATQNLLAIGTRNALQGLAAPVAIAAGSPVQQ